MFRVSAVGRYDGNYAVSGWLPRSNHRGGREIGKGGNSRRSGSIFRNQRLTATNAPPFLCGTHVTQRETMSPDAFDGSGQKGWEIIAHPGREPPAILAASHCRRGMTSTLVFAGGGSPFPKTAISPVAPIHLAEL